MHTQSASSSWESEDAPVVEIKSASTALKIRFIGYPYADADYWNRNYVTIDISATVPGFIARFREEVHLDQLRDFHAALLRMHADLKGSAELNVMDAYLELEGTMDLIGHIRWTCRLQYPGGYGAQLRFEIQSDQSYLPTLIGQIDSVFEALPVRQDNAD